MHAKALASTPTHNILGEGYIKAVGGDEPTTPQEDMTNVTEIDGGILEYVREQMHCKTVTREVRRQAALFQQEMDRMQGW
jgi:hypothetical protein